MASELSVIVPVLDEAARIGRALRALAATPGVDEVIVVDGGSADRTVEIARSFPGVRVLDALRGRGPQMNAGARAASGAVLLFLRAAGPLRGEGAAQGAGARAAPGGGGGVFRTGGGADGGGGPRGPL